MRLFLGFALCFAFVLSGCSGEEVKTDIKNAKPNQAPTRGSLHNNPAGRQVN